MNDILRESCESQENIYGDRLTCVAPSILLTAS